MASTIDKLPDDIKTQLREWLKSPHVTIAQARERANELLEELEIEPVSHGAVGRENRKIKLQIERIGKEMRTTKAATQSFYDQFGDQLGEGGKFLAESMQAFILKLNLALFKLEDAAISPESVLDHSKAVKNLTGSILQIENALTKYTDREKEIREDERQANAEEAMKAAKKGGLSAEVAETIRRQILGVQ